MYEIEFGKLIDKLIYFSGQKNYSLAMKLGYDVSYISKWINLNMLPSAKNIKNISKTTSEFIVNSSSESSLDDISEYFNIEFNQDDSESKKEIIKEVIEDSIYKSFLYSYNKFNNNDLEKHQEKNNSIQIINGSIRKNYLSENININSLFHCEMIVLCNLFSINKEDKLNIASIKNYENKDFLKVRYIINFDDNVDDIISDIMLFIEMVTSKSRINIELYSCDFSGNTLITVVKDKFVNTSIYYNNKCLTTVMSHDNNVIKEMYNTLEDMINFQSKPMFNLNTSKEMIISEDYMNYIIDEDLKLILGEINELFMPSDLFLEVGKSLYGNDKEVLIKLKKIDTILQNITYNSKLSIIMFESALKKYVSSGNITFFNNPVTLTLKQRQKQLNYMRKIIFNNEKIDFRIIENSLLDNIKIDQNLSLYLSKNTSFLKEEYNGNDANYMIINDKKLNNLLNNFFEKIWIERIDLNYNDKEGSENIILESLRYINILNDNNIQNIY